MTTSIAWATLLAALLAGTASAGPGHDHGEPTTTTATTSSPRFAAHSDLFELVGIANGATLLLYLDSYASNTPIGVADIELELQPASGAARKFKAAQAEDGSFKIDLGKPLAEGVTAITATIRARIADKPEDDLLSGSIEIPSRPADSTAHGGDIPIRALGTAGAVLALLIGLFIGFRFRARRARRIGGLT